MNPFLSSFKLGATHVLYSQSYEYLFFMALFFLLFSYSLWEKMVWLITTLLIGHLFTLLLFSYAPIHVNSRSIPILMYVLILVAALFNLLNAKDNSKLGKWNANLFFGLLFGMVQGLTFLNYFRPISSRSLDKLGTIAQFMLGVEGVHLGLILVMSFFAFMAQLIFEFSKKDSTLVLCAITTGIIGTLLFDIIF